ncbi:hypothetical protein D9M69_595580 [compost metagenome]
MQFGKEPQIYIRRTAVSPRPRNRDISSACLEQIQALMPRISTTVARSDIDQGAVELNMGPVIVDVVAMDQDILFGVSAAMDASG